MKASNARFILMVKLIKILIGFLVFVIVCVVGFMCVLNIMTSAVDKNNNTNIDVVIDKNATISNLGTLLLDKGLIKSELFYKIYVKLNVKSSYLQAGKYVLNKSMDLKEIMDILGKGSNYNPDTIRITFKEGYNVRTIAREIEANTINKYDDIMNVFTDRTYASELVNKYWFLDEKILSSSIYYPLEGYLFPDTYEFLNKEVSVKTIVGKMLDEFGVKIEPYKEKIESSSFSVNDIVILASIAEIESLPGSDRKGVVGVFVNRINAGISLGSDMTAYYAYKLDDLRLGLSYSEFNNCSNPYNTRCLNKLGLPVGSISNPGIDSLVGAIEYTKHDYYFFVADCNGKTYFSHNDAEQQKVISNLKNQNLWCEVSA